MQSLNFVGDSSSYQKRTILILSMIQCSFSFLVMGLPFLFKGPIFLCINSQSQTYPCVESQSCDAGVIYQEINTPNTITFEFQLWCDRKYIIAIAGSLIFFGSTISGFIFPQLSARKGRVWCILVACGISVISLTIAAAIQSLPILLLSFFLSGLAQSGFENEAFVYLSEISGEKFRNFSQVILNAVWGASQILFALIMQYTQNWRIILTLIIAFPMFIAMILTYNMIYESPRYLVAQRMYDNARFVLSKIGQLNGRPLFQYKFENEIDDDRNVYYFSFEFKKIKKQKERQLNKVYKKFLTRQLMIKSQDAGQHDNEERLVAMAQSYSYIDLFRYRSLRSVSISLLFLWTFRYQVYYGLAFTMLSFGDDVMDNLFFLAISEVVAGLLSVSVKMKFNRIPSLGLLIMISSLSSILIYFPNIPQNCFHLFESCYQQELSILLGMIVKFSITIYADVLITYTTEVYPTVVRSLGLGQCISIGKLGIIFMPIIVNYFQYRGINPLIVFGIAGIVPFLCLNYLSETKSKRMDDYIYESQINDKPFIELSLKQ